MMNNQFLNKISIEEVVECEVTPEHAQLKIIVKGESVFFGNEAFSKSKEIARLIAELNAIGYLKENIKLMHVSIQTSTGKVRQHSSARFHLLLDNISLKKMPQLLGILSAQKNLDIGGLDYEFGDLKKQKAYLLIEACKNAKQQGQEICRTWEVNLLGVHSMVPKWRNPFDDKIPHEVSMQGWQRNRMRNPEPDELQGLDFTTDYVGKLCLTLKVDFRVSEFIDSAFF
ncbi:MAG: SIMPL domain-containing protein [Pseudomonadota bacterium]